MGTIGYENLANYIIAYCNLKNIDITNKKLQKLLYYCQAWSLALYDGRLVDHSFEAWVHGAVLRSVYFKYSELGHNSIVMGREKAIEIINEFEGEVPPSQMHIIKKVLDRYANFSSDTLEKMNHSEYPWLKTRDGLGRNEKCSRPIPDDVIKEYYRAKALEKGMKKVKDNRFKFSSAGLKRAQEALKKKEVFKVTEDNYKEYEKFILDSYNATVETTARSEYGRNL